MTRIAFVKMKSNFIRCSTYNYINWNYLLQTISFTLSRFKLKCLNQISVYFVASIYNASNVRWFGVFSLISKKRYHKRVKFSVLCNINDVTLMTSVYVRKRKRDDPEYKMHFNLILFNWKVFIFIYAYVNFYVSVPGVSLHKSVHDACDRALIE